MEMALVNRYLAFTNIAGKETTLHDFSNCVALALCTKVIEGDGGLAHNQAIPEDSLKRTRP